MNPKIVIGMAWYRNESDFKRCREICTDRDKLPLTFLDWLNKAEQGRKIQIAKGHIVVRAYIDPDNFAAWCMERGTTIDAAGRMAFASAEALRIAKLDVN